MFVKLTYMQFSIRMQAVAVILMIGGIYSIHEFTLGLLVKNEADFVIWACNSIHISNDMRLPIHTVICEVV